MIIDNTNFKRLIVTYKSQYYELIRTYDKKDLDEKFKIHDNIYRIPNKLYFYNDMYIINSIYFEK